MQVTKYVSEASPASLDFAIAVMDFINDLVDNIEDFEDRCQASWDLMRFIYGDGQ